MEPTAGPFHDSRTTMQRLYRSRNERQLGGVAGGIARYANIDPTLIRVLFIVLAVMGPGLLLYPLLWVFVPEEPQVLPAMNHDRQDHQAGESAPSAA